MAAVLPISKLLAERKTILQSLLLLCQKWHQELLIERGALSPLSVLPRKVSFAWSAMASVAFLLAFAWPRHPN